MTKRHLCVVAFWAALGAVGCTSDVKGVQRTPAGVTIPSDIQAALAELPSAQVVAAHASGVPTFVRGSLGRVSRQATVRGNPGQLAEALRPVARVFRIPVEQLDLQSVQEDELGYRHLSFSQSALGLPMVGGEWRAHLDSNGRIYAAHGESAGFDLPDPDPGVSAQDAQTYVGSLPQYQPCECRALRLVLVLVGSEPTVQLAWEVEASGNTEGLPIWDRVYVSASARLPGQAPEVVAVYPQIQTLRTRSVYDAHHGSGLPGDLVLAEGGEAVADRAVMAAYDNLGTVYDCYATLFGRDSVDNLGAPIVGTVHYGSALNTAFWQGTEIVFGDGDGTLYGNVPAALDVAAHELTHGVIKYSADLLYANEPGAVNEGFADVMAAVCEAWHLGEVSARTFMVGEDMYTPGIAGDALRYMSQPVLDGVSRDFYPERYVGSADYGGVHWNSGMVNLAFYLLSQGGSHPRGKTPALVPAQGLTAAGRIFYRAMTTYLTSQSGIEATRAATAQAALDLYGDSCAAATQKAWDAVAAPGGTEEPGDNSGTALVNGTTVVGLSGAATEELRFHIDIPSGATALTITMSGGTGDADIYVRFGSAPTTSTYDFRPYATGNDETVTPSTIEAGTWYIMVRGYQAFDGVDLVVSYDATTAEPPVTTLVSGIPVTNIAGARGAERLFRLDVPTGTTAATFQMSGGSGDADLYVRYGVEPTINAYDVRPFLFGNAESAYPMRPQAGIWYALVRGYSAFAGVTLVGSYSTDLPADVVLLNGIPAGGLSATTGQELHFMFDVPSGTTQVSIAMTGAQGDADMYVRVGAPATTTLYDYRPYSQTSNESVTVPNPVEGRWYVLVRAYTAFSGLSLAASCQ